MNFELSNATHSSTPAHSYYGQERIRRDALFQIYWVFAIKADDNLLGSCSFSLVSLPDKMQVN